MRPSLFERLLYYPLLFAATGLTLLFVYRHPGPVTYAVLVWLAGLWLLTFVRALWWIARVGFYLTCLGALVAVWTLGPRLTDLLRPHP